MHLSLIYHKNYKLEINLAFATRFLESIYLLLNLPLNPHLKDFSIKN